MQINVRRSLQFGAERTRSSEQRDSDSQPQRASRFYGPGRISSPVRTWQPGEYLPRTSTATHSPSPNPPPDFHALIMNMQQAVTSEIHKVQLSVESLAHRVDKIENDICNINEQEHGSASASVSACTPPIQQSMSTARKKCTPVALSVSLTIIIIIITVHYYQNLIRSIHNTLDEEKQLKPKEK